MQAKKKPERMCIGCREQKEKNELCRVVRDKDGNINILFTNRSETLPANVNFTFQDGKYRLKTVRRIHGDVKEADNY